MNIEAMKAWVDGIDELYMDGASPDDGHTPERMLGNVRELIGAVRGLLVAVEAAVAAGKAPMYICNGPPIVESQHKLPHGAATLAPPDERLTAGAPPGGWGR